MTVQLPAFPTPLRWLNEPASWTADEIGLTLTAAPQTDRFIDPETGSVTDTAPALLGDVSAVGDYQLSARVNVDFSGDYDAAVLLLWAGPASYAKFCFEYSPQRQPMAVSVVTRGGSDDANGFAVDGKSLWMRIAKLGSAFAFHASTDGAWWHFVRYFDLGADREPELGFQVQAPVGDGCTACFTDITFVPERLQNLRDGS
jgi:regulation of enolase protein 1 (concanavalin A-like superfamily)